MMQRLKVKGYILLLLCLLVWPVTCLAQARDHLTSSEQVFYDALLPQIAEIAAGRQAETVVSLIFLEKEQIPDMTGEGIVIPRIGRVIGFDAEALGISSLYMDSLSGKKYLTAEARTALAKKMHAMSERILLALMQDCPMELFWFNKKEGLGMEYNCVQAIVGGGDQVILSDVTCHMTVDSAYRGGSAYRTDRARIETAGPAFQKASSILAGAAGKSDAQKLAYFRDCILELAVYDSNPGESGPSYEAISVFDGDPATAATCEGYAKAFQYLCNHAFPVGTCLYVYGDVQIRDEAGNWGSRLPHAWNIVRMNGSRMLVDLTNCDTEAIGEPDILFMCGQTGGSVQSSYLVPLEGEGEVRYSYDPACRDFFSANELTLAAHVHEPVTVIENEAEAQIGVRGSYDEVSYCERCLRELSRRTVWVEALPGAGPDDGGNHAGSGSGSSTAGTGSNGTNHMGPAGSGIDASMSGRWIAASVPMKTGTKVKAQMIVDLASGDQVIGYHSSNTRIVKVSGTKDGSVTLRAGRKMGTATLTATLRSGGKCRMKVRVSGRTVLTRKLRVQVAARQMKVGERMQIRAERTPVTSNQKVTYAVSRPAVLSVSASGRIRAKKPGTAVITIRSGSKVKKLKIKVKK